ncbi:MAG TPA: hypothetical protein VFB44_11750 [Thermoleophilaceae bacterium]|nr:hypothetical protein [Thermoleophilaceae bacterium]
MVAPVSEAYGGDEGLEPLAVGLVPSDPHRQQDVLLGVQDRQQVVALEDEADPLAAMKREFSIVQLIEAGAVDFDPTARGSVETGEDVISVDLPEPDGPMIAVNDPRSKSTETPRRASTAAAPSPKRLVIS